jgi:hypothetical protein
VSPHSARNDGSRTSPEACVEGVLQKTVHAQLSTEFDPIEGIQMAV